MKYSKITTINQQKKYSKADIKRYYQNNKRACSMSKKSNILNTSNSPLENSQKKLLNNNDEIQSEISQYFYQNCQCEANTNYYNTTSQPSISEIQQLIQSLQALYSRKNTVILYNLFKDQSFLIPNTLEFPYFDKQQQNSSCTKVTRKKQSHEKILTQKHNRDANLQILLQGFLSNPKLFCITFNARQIYLLKSESRQIINCKPIAVQSSVIKIIEISMLQHVQKLKDEGKIKDFLISQYQEMPCERSTINKIWKKYNEQGIYEDQRQYKSGRPKTLGALTLCPQNNNKKQSEGPKAHQSRRLPSIKKTDPLPGTVEGADPAPSPAENPLGQHLRLEGDKYLLAGHHSQTLKTLEIALKAIHREITGQDSIQKLVNSGTIVDALKNQINDGKVLVEVKQLKFMQWTEVQQLAQNLTQGVLEQAVSIATINKNAERNYKKELKQLKQIDDDPTHALDLKVNAFNKYYDKLIKTDKKSDAAKKYNSNKSSQQKIDQKSNSNQNQNQSEIMDVEYMKTNKNNNQKKNNQQKSPHNNNQSNNNKSTMEEEIDFEKKEIKTILKKNNTNSEQNQQEQKQNKTRKSEQKPK
ncbi:hypothetical protein ABPG72_005916 [Tetrahymena utriculariae]